MLNDSDQFKNLNQHGQKKQAKKLKPLKGINIPVKQTYQTMNSTRELPLDHSCQVYPRVSTPEQMDNVSVEMQKDKSFALSCGWKDHMIIVDDRDLGVSGQLRMEDRKAFNVMLRRIAKGEIKAVVVFNVDRLFRDRWGDESGKFMEICRTYDVLIVTPDFVYDFCISWHIGRFKRRCEEAWNYLEYHVYGRMLAAKFERARNGFWIGGGIPFGYIIDLKEKLANGELNPKYYHFIPYEPHAQVVRRLFRRYKELNDNMKALMIEIEAKPPLFPDFEADVDPLIVSQFKRMKVDGGYAITTMYGLRSLLTNRSYIGYWLFKDEIINTQNHDAIVDLTTFIYAYNRLSQTQFDGEENGRLKTRRERHAKRHYADRPAILKEVIESGDPNVRIYVKNGENRGKVHVYYSFNYQTEGKEWTHTRGTVDAIGFDRIVLERLREHLQISEAEQGFRDFKKTEPKAIEEAKEDLRDIERDIEATKANMARVKAQVELGQLADPDLAQAANASYAAAKLELKRLEERKGATERIAQEDNERRSYKMLMCEVNEAWDEILPPEEHPRLVYLFIERVTLMKVSPSFCVTFIEWKDPMWEGDKCLIFKGSTAWAKWEDDEIAVLEKHYPAASWEELEELLPERSRKAMCDYYRRKNRENPRQANGLSFGLCELKGLAPCTICPADWKIMQASSLSEERYKKFEGAKLITNSYGVM